MKLAFLLLVFFVVGTLARPDKSKEGTSKEGKSSSEESKKSSDESDKSSKHSGESKDRSTSEESSCEDSKESDKGSEIKKRTADENVSGSSEDSGALVKGDDSSTEEQLNKVVRTILPILDEEQVEAVVNFIKNSRLSSAIPLFVQIIEANVNILHELQQSNPFKLIRELPFIGTITKYIPAILSVPRNTMSVILARIGSAISIVINHIIRVTMGF